VPKPLSRPATDTNGPGNQLTPSASGWDAGMPPGTRMMIRYPVATSSDRVDVRDLHVAAPGAQ